MSKPTIARCVSILLALAVGGCATSDAVTGTAPVYPPGYQPVMGGYAANWPEQPGAQWGPEDVPQVDVFYAPLAVHGRWVQSRWGQVFVPAAPQGWRPYVNGRWLDNRYWLSADPWGWATDHYGRWGFEEGLGWVWVPGTSWGPSWVAWREADDVVGWAPIPPQVQWSVGIGFGGGPGFDNWGSWYGPSWVWVPRGTLFLSGFGGRILPWNVGISWWGRSRWQHAPYWGWNQPWDRGWGWRAPGRGFGNQGGWNRGWNGGGWNGGGWNRGWNRGWNGGQGRGWNNDPRQGGWNNGPRRGQPGSIGDAIGRDLAGEPPARPPGGFGGNRRADNQRGGNWASRGGNGAGNDNGLSNDGVMRQRPPIGQQAGDPDMAGRRAGGFGGGFGGNRGGMVAPQARAQADSQPQRQPSDAAPPPRREPQYRSEPQPRSEPQYRSEPAQRREAPADRGGSGRRAPEQ